MRGEISMIVGGGATWLMASDATTLSGYSPTHISG